MKYETVFYNTGTKIIAYATNCVYAADLMKLFTAAHKKQVTKYEDKKIYYSYSKFPKKLAQRAGFTTVSDPANADLIVIPTHCSYHYASVFHAVKINDKLHYKFPLDRIDVKKYVQVYKQMNKYIDLMDTYGDKCIISSTFYEYCRAYNPAMTNSEYENVKELLKSSDRECNILGATLIVKSDINMRKNIKLMSEVNRILRDFELPETNENLEFRYTFENKCTGAYKQWCNKNESSEYLL